MRNIIAAAALVVALSGCENFLDGYTRAGLAGGLLATSRGSAETVPYRPQPAAAPAPPPQMHSVTCMPMGPFVNCNGL